MTALVEVIIGVKELPNLSQLILKGTLTSLHHCWDVTLKTKKSTLRWPKRESQGIVKVSRIHLLRTVNVRTKFHDNPSNICRGIFQSWPTDDRWRGLEIFKWCNRSQSTTPYSSPDVYVLAAPSHLAHSFMHTFSKHCPPTLDPGATPCEGPASRERSSCPSASPRLITLKQHRGTHKTRSVLACQNEKKITVSPPLVCFIARESSWSSLSRSFWNPCLFKIQSCRQIHRDGSIHMIQTWGNKHPNER